MKSYDIIRARDAASAFVKLCDAVIEERKQKGSDALNKPGGIAGTKKSGGLNRLSMSLTRLLANMRNPK